jgi:hypothetical protein
MGRAEAGRRVNPLMGLSGRATSGSPGPSCGRSSSDLPMLLMTHVQVGAILHHFGASAGNALA